MDRKESMRRVPVRYDVPVMSKGTGSPVNLEKRFCFGYNGDNHRFDEYKTNGRMERVDCKATG